MMEYNAVIKILSYDIQTYIRNHKYIKALDNISSKIYFELMKVYEHACIRVHMCECI